MSSPSAPPACASTGSAAYSGGKRATARGVDIRRVGAGSSRIARLRGPEQVALLERDTVLNPCSSTLRAATSSAPGETSTASMRALGKTRAARMASEPPPVQRSSAEAIVAGSPMNPLSSAKRGHQQFADQAARDDDALVDIERHALDVSAIDEIGGGLARRYARLDQFHKPQTLGAQKPGVEKGIERVDRQAQAFEDEKGGLVERGRRAMAESEIGSKKAADRIAQPVSRGKESFDPLVRSEELGHALGLGMGRHF